MIKTSNTRFYTMLALCIIIMFTVALLPPFGDMTPYGMKVFGIFIGCIVGWLLGIVLPICMVSLVAMGLLLDGLTVDGMLISLHGLPMIAMIFWALIFVYALGKCGLLHFLANKIMALKFCTKSPWHLAVGIWLCAMICGGLTSQPMPTIIVMFSIFYSIAEKVGAQKRSRYTAFTLAGMTVSVVVSCSMVPYAPGLLMGLSFMSAAVPGIEYNIPLLCLIDTCVTLATILIMAIILKVAIRIGIIKPEFTLSNAENLMDNNVKFDKRVKLGFFFILLLLIIMLFPSFLPADSALKLWLGRIGSVGIFVVAVTLMCLIPIDGKRLLDLESALNDGAINWTLYFMLGTALVLSEYLLSSESGLTTTLQNIVNNLALNMNPYLICLLLLTICLILTNCLNNTVCFQLMIPIIAIVLTANEINPAIIVGLASIVLDHGLILPSGSPFAALFTLVNT